METLQRLLMSGRLDGAAALARSSRPARTSDPFAGCLAGYVLLRLGLHDELGDLADEIVGVAPKLSDAYILRGEHEAAAGRPETAGQAFADAVNAGIPAFGEGLTRLVEGLRATASTTLAAHSCGISSNVTCADRCGRRSRLAKSSSQGDW